MNIFKILLILIFLLIRVEAGFLDKIINIITPAKEEVVYDNSDLGEPVTDTTINQNIDKSNSSDTYVIDDKQNKSTNLGEMVSPGSSEIIYTDEQNIQNNNIQNIKKISPPKEVKIENYRRGEFKIALLVPKKVIGGYASRVSNAILSYFILKGKNFDYEVFDSKDESQKNLLKTLSKIKAKGYNFVIAPLTKKGAKIITNYEKNIIIYIPTINKKNITIPTGNIIYGGIDYKKQINKLLDYTNAKIAIFSGKSEVARRLTSYIYNSRYDNIYLKSIKSSKINPKWLLKNNYHLQNASIFFNLPLVSTALIVSSFRSYGIKPYGIFSTQINYSPLLFNMIQKKDRQNIYIANSIGYVNSKLIDIDKNFGNSIKYDWVIYSSTIGLDYIYSKFYDIDPIFFEYISKHQVKYKTKIMKIVGNEFRKAR